MAKEVKKKSENKPDALNALLSLLDRLSFMEKRMAEFEQNLATLTIGADAVNAISSITIRSVAQILLAAVTPVSSQQVEAEVQEEQIAPQEEVVQPA